jgi:hypothetical protein
MLSDIGIGIEEDMEVLIEKGTGLPHEFTCKMSLHIDSISIYEGCSPFLKNNTCLGTYLFNNIKEGTFVFTLKVDTDYKMKILVDDVLLDTVQCKNVEYEYEYTLSQEELERKAWLNNRNEYRDYIKSSLFFITETFVQDQLSKKDISFLNEKLLWARQVLDCPDVSAQEYKDSLAEIEGIVNPVLKKLKNKIEK